MSAGETRIEVAEEVRYEVVGPYSGIAKYDTFDAAVEEARSRIETFDYGENGKRDSRAFIALRQRSRSYGAPGPESGLDAELIRWEVYRDSVAQVPAGQGGLTPEQRDMFRPEDAPRPAGTV